MTQVKIVGSEAFCANGLSKKKIFDACLQKKSAVLESGLAPISENYWNHLKSELSSGSTDISRCLLASQHTLQKAISEAQWGQAELSDCGFIFATTTSQIDQWQNSLPFCYSKNLSAAEIVEKTKYQSLGVTVFQLQKEFQINGPSTVIASSCSASLQALGMAALWIRMGKVKRCLVGSTEILSDLTVNGFSSLRLLTKGACKPFDQNRNGINLGEASAFLCLEAGDLSTRKAQAVISGVGFSSDAFHPTSPQPEGLGSIRAIQMALQNSKLQFENIDWVYAHGTGSGVNDLTEAKSIRSLSSDRVLHTPITSTKSIHGHTLGACGALESILAVMAIQNRVILPTFNTDRIDSAIALNIVQQPQSISIKHVLKNSLGFGGINASIILSKSEEGLT